jgi:hypothetical protein
MATKLPAKPRRTLLQEAADPSTAPERIRQLADHKNRVVQRAAIRNPSLPEEVWCEALINGEPEAWANPMASIYLLTWTPRKNDFRTVEDAARRATQGVWAVPERCSLEGKVLLNAKVKEWWVTSESASDMAMYLGWWALAKGDGSTEHRETVRLLLLCVRTAPHLTDDDRQALDLLQTWATGGANRRKEARDLADSEAIMDVGLFAHDPSYYPWRVINEVLMAVSSGKQGRERKEAKAEHERHLADVIRREMPLPPVVA